MSVINVGIVVPVKAGTISAPYVLCFQWVE